MVTVMSNPFKKLEFKALLEEWNTKLKESGFVDVEDSNNYLIKRETRISNVTSLDLTAQFYNLLDEYLANSTSITPRDRKILTLYSGGAHVCGFMGISDQVKMSPRMVHYIIKKHRSAFLKRS
jgi:hypothetical protein